MDQEQEADTRELIHKHHECEQLKVMIDLAFAKGHDAGWGAKARKSVNVQYEMEQKLHRFKTEHGI